MSQFNPKIDRQDSGYSSSGGDYLPLKEVRSPTSVRPGHFQNRVKNKGKWKVWEFLKACAPILEWLPEYPWREHSKSDIGCGLTLGFILVAQSLAHAQLCKVHVIHGPYSCIVPLLIYSVFGTCIHSSVGTGGLISLLTGEELAKIGDTIDERTHACALFTMEVGLFMALMGVFRLSFLVRFLSQPALSGFVTGSAILIIASQLKPAMGIADAHSPRTGYPLWNTILHDPASFKTLNWCSFAISLLSYLWLSTSKTWKKLNKVAKFVADFKELVNLAVASLFCYFFAERFQVSLVGDVEQGLPGFHHFFQQPSDWQLAKDMLPGAILVSLVTFLSSFAGAKKFAMKGGYQVKAINELFALGMANCGGALFEAVPTQIGLSRMGIAHEAGVKSQLGANIYVAVVVAFVVQFGTETLRFVPDCVLNVIIINGASHLMEWGHMTWLWKLRGGDQTSASDCCGGERVAGIDFGVWWIACVATVALGAFEGVIVAVVFSLLLLVYQVAEPPIQTLGWRSNHGRWMPMDAYEDAKPRNGVLVFRVEGPIFYGNVERLQEWIIEAEMDIEQNSRVLRGIVVSCSSVPWVDSTALKILKDLITNFKNRNILFYIANASGQAQCIFEKELKGLLPEGIECDVVVQECVEDLSNREKKRRALAKLPPVPMNASNMFRSKSAHYMPRTSSPRPLLRPAEFSAKNTSIRI